MKAFNTVFGHMLAQGNPLDVLITGDDAEAKATMAAFIKSLGLRPMDTGPLGMARWLEGTGLVMIGLGRYGAGSFNFTLGVSTLPERARTTTSRATSITRTSSMRVFVTGGTGHSGSYIIPELIAAGHEVTGLARSDTAAAALSALGAKVRRGDLQDLDGLKEAATDSDGIIHVAHRQDLLFSGGIHAVAAAELPIMLAYGEALAGTGKPLVATGSIGSPGQGFLGRTATEEDPALPSGDEHKGTLRARNVVETAVVGLAEQGVRSSVVRIANIAHSTTDRAGFLPTLIALAKEKGFIGYPGDGANLWNAVHIRDVASLFRLALEKGPAGKYWHAVDDGGIPFREIAEAIGSRLGLPAVSVPVDELVLPGYFGFLANIVTQSYPASNLVTRRTLGWEPAQPRLLADLDNGHYFPAS
ncbi:NAD-dependent epimerase/dehydratase family protein [Nonomuraea guangzhouensis]|uniref:NAD-dependent epimerase/dehydratase family protein n=1 Tax=Nonomuraea guangzhouensis TaxID=1291555 RepID=A0ABW4GRS4_9ACTN|nr:NAD-dependent epimerase/dehydratase family protein [Nonomuraea guangzhouensis]